MDTPRSSSGQNPSTDPADLSGVTISGQANVTARDIIGRDKIIHGDEYIGYTAAQLTVLLDKIRTEYQSKPFDGHSPYIGLASFQERDADKFFGRETLTAELVTRVATSASSNARAVFVAGPSGSGKSSLVRAGLVPALKKGQVAGSEHWLYETLKPGRAPLDELGLAVAKLARNSDLRIVMTTRGLTDATFLNQQADMALTDDSKQRAVIVIDQFEEIFTQLSAERENERVAFLDLLTHAATIENGRMLVIFTLRSDFVANCASYPNLNALVNQQFIQVGAMTPDELVSAIARPAYQVGLRIDPALISQIVNDVRGEPGALPLMQFALQDLFEAEKSRGELTLDGYLARGGLHQALERHADAEFAKLDEAEKQLARSVFSGLIEIGRGREDTKRTALFGELVPAGADAVRVQALVHKLADARLITTDEQDGKETVTLAHERLIDAWDWLRRLVDENREAIALQNEIAQDAQEWEIQKRDESYLYRGARLATAQEKLQQSKLMLSTLALEFVEMAIAVHERERAYREAARQRELEQERQRADAEERARRAAEKSAATEKQRGRILRFSAVGLTGLLLAAILAACFAIQQQSEASRQANQRGTAEANAVKDRDAAVQANSTSQAANATAQAEAIAREREISARSTAEANALNEKNRAEEVARLNNARRLAAMSTSNIDKQFNFALLLSLESLRIDTNADTRGSLLSLLQSQPQIIVYLQGFKDQVLSVAYSPDGKTIATAGADGTLIIWDAKTYAKVSQSDLSYPIVSLSYSPDGKRLLIGTGFYSMVLWDVTTRKKISSFRIGGYGQFANALFTPDGKLIAGANLDGDILVYDASGTPPQGEMIYDPFVQLKIKTLSQIAFSPDGKYLAAVGGTLEKSIHIWDTKTWQQIGEPLNGSEQMVSVAFSADNKTLATGGLSGKVVLWDVESRQNIGQELLGHSEEVRALAFSPNGSFLASGSKDGSIIFWDTKTQKILGTPLRGHRDNIYNIAFSPDGANLVSVSRDNAVILWNIIPQIPIEQSVAGPSGLNKIALSGDGTILASTSREEPPRLWDLRTNQRIGELHGLASNVLSGIEFSPNGKMIASIRCMGFGDGKCKMVIDLWDRATLGMIGEPLATDYDYLSYSDISNINFRSDGKTIVSIGCVYRDSSEANHFRYNCKRVEINIWDASRHRSVRSPFTVEMDSIDSVAFSPDGRTVAIGGCVLRQESAKCEIGEIWLWSLISQQPIANPVIAHLDTVSALSFNPDGSLLASGSKDGTVILWDVQDEQQTSQPLRGHKDSIFGVAFVSDGQVLASSSVDNTTILWDVKTGVQLGSPLVESQGKKTTFTNASSVDGSKIATASYQGNIVIWDVDIESWKAKACSIAGRNLKRTEWEQYVKSGDAIWDEYVKNPTCPNLPIEQ